MVNTYHLVNPSIAGNFNSKIKARNSIEAANMLYKSLSEHFSSSIPKFYFTIQKGSSSLGQYYHFKVSETTKADEVNFTIRPYNVENNEINVRNFKNNLNRFKAKFEQLGGKKGKVKKSKKVKSSDSDSDSDLDVSSDELYKRVQSYVPVTQPIYYWWYDPYVYNLNSVFLPTFYSYLNPLMELSLVVVP